MNDVAIITLNAESAIFVQVHNDLPEDTSDRSQVWLSTCIIMFHDGFCSFASFFLYFIHILTSFSRCEKNNEKDSPFTQKLYWSRSLEIILYSMHLHISMCVPIRFAATSRKYIKFINHIERKIYSLRTQTRIFTSPTAVVLAVWQRKMIVEWKLLQRMCLIYIYYLLTMDNFRKDIVITPDLMLKHLHMVHIIQYYYYRSPNLFEIVQKWNFDHWTRTKNKRILLQATKR